ncbi:hypothetical protein NITLEN_60210 [Nitrospira lenta]|uniref:Uncharacterized protein n=1 Tax=Nitrospira lenta TaxID=1436998 RepID=A0A330LBV6_9BACT|nr:hypothetical protein NITLEN_60210 [Nitrospira lenta]
MLDKVMVCILEGGRRIANGSGKFKNEPSKAQTEAKTKRCHLSSRVTTRATQHSTSVG